jgi:hypothetical protein
VRDLLDDRDEMTDAEVRAQPASAALVACRDLVRTLTNIAVQDSRAR